jgi:tetratricopeptide (TPR) repeat protein
MIDWNRCREIQELRDSGHPAEALDEFESLRANSENAEEASAILLHIGICYRDLGRFDDAAAAVSEALRLLPAENPTRPYAEFTMAVIRECQGKWDLAAQELREFIKRHEDLLRTDEYTWLRHDAQTRLIAILIALDQAIEPLSIVNSLKTENIPPEMRAELSYREAVAHGILGRRDHALKSYEEAISGPLKRPLAARAHFHIGEILYDRGEFSRALDEFKIAETVAETSSQDRENFAAWIENARRALADDKPVGY